jgi:hypothetical protein
MTPDREPVGQGINYILDALDIIAKMALREDQFDEVAAEEAALWTVKNHVEWILSYIKTRQDAEPPTLRVVK